VSLLPTLLGSGLGELGDSVLVSRGTTLAPDVGDRFSRDAWLAGQHRTSVSRQQVPSTGAPRFLELSATPDPFSEQPGKFQHVPGRRVHDVVSNQILIPTGFIGTIAVSRDNRTGDLFPLRLEIRNACSNFSCAEVGNFTGRHSCAKFGSIVLLSNATIKAIKSNDPR
jgi:hypothetical protein